MIFGKRSPFYVLRHRNYRLLWLGLLISRIGSEMQTMAVNWHIYLLTGSPIALGLIGLSRFLPIVVFSLGGGIVADLFNRKRIMFAAQICMTIFSLVLAVTTLTHTINPFILYLMTALTTTAGVFDTPARQSSVPHLVPREEFVKATSLNLTNYQSSLLLGPAIGGFVIGYLGLSAVYFINALSFVAVIVALFVMGPIPKVMLQTTTFSLKSIKEGLNFVFHTPIIYSTMLLDFFATFFASATVLMPIYAKDILHVGAKGLGFLYAAPAIGAIVAGLIASSHGEFKNQGKILLMAVSIYGISSALFGLSRIFYLSLLLLAISGAGDMLSAIIRNSIRQLRTSDHLRGRMVSINQIFFMGGPQLGEVEAGLVAGFVSTPFAVVTGGIATVLSALTIAYLVPAIRNYKGEEIV